jgi:uncharacterized protein YbgA (DUF1722 family)/uncharacterized protein YbbK (DUF523 family)
MSPQSVPKPRVVVSQCLNLQACRYNSEVISDSFLRLLGSYVQFVPVCPEVSIGLGVPRRPVRLVASKRMKNLRLIQPDVENHDLTRKMQSFGREFLDELKEVDGFVLKSASPSCAVKDAKRYSTPQKGSSIGKGPGLFGQAVRKRYPHLVVEDEGRLSNLRLREHFLTRIFTWTRFRQLKKSPTMAKLVRFQNQHKYLLMAYNQSKMRALGRIVANPEKALLRDVLSKYEEQLAKALARLPRYTSHINVLMHCFGYVSDRLSTREKEHFLNLLQQYRKERVQLSAALSILSSWIIRFDVPYLSGQFYFEPFPMELISLHDSGKKRR